MSVSLLSLCMLIPAGFTYEEIIVPIQTANVAMMVMFYYWLKEKAAKAEEKSKCCEL